MIINHKLIELNLTAQDKDSAILELIAKAREDNRLKDEKQYLNDVLARENDVSTAIGYEIAIPHGKSDGVQEPFVAFGRTMQSVKWEDQDVKMIFLIGVPKVNLDNLHLRLLAEISKKLIEESYRENLLNASTKEEIESLLINPLNY